MTNHSNGRNNTIPYTRNDIDYIFVYSMNGYYAFLPAEVWEGKMNISIRYKESKNNINYLMFTDYSFDIFLSKVTAKKSRNYNKISCNK